jgi:hypothetical protein
MAEIDSKKPSEQREFLDPAVQGFLDILDDKHRMLVVLKTQLYGDRWEPMLEDLQNRLEGKPYIFKLVNRIKDDIERIQQMRSFEAEHNMKLSDFLKLS